MTYGRVTSQYLEADILSRPKEWLVPLVYEHLISSMTRARVQMESGDLEGKAKSLQKASDIVFELLIALDRERGGELAGQLASVYTFLAGEIVTVGRTMDTAYLARLTAIVSELHEAWVQAAEQVAPRGRGGAPSLAALRA
jgi:flagellar secretion chaperone FliS